jgi:hypothetical protein
MSTTKVRSPAGTVLARRQAKTYIDPRIGADRGSLWRVRPAAPRTQSPGHETVVVRPAYDVEQPISLTRHIKLPAAGTACPMEPPVGSLVRPRGQRPKHLKPWGAANFSGLVFHHPRLFIPQNVKPPDGWVDGIYASQNPANCTRFLLLENDVSHAGLGMQARFILQALLLAVRDQRVLLEIPSSHPNRSKLWCDRAPYTFECVFAPWSYCPAPDLERAKAAGQITSPKVRFPYSFWDTNLPVAKVGID